MLGGTCALLDKGLFSGDPRWGDGAELEGEGPRTEPAKSICGKVLETTRRDELVFWEPSTKVQIQTLYLLAVQP